LLKVDPVTISETGVGNEWAERGKGGKKFTKGVREREGEKVFEKERSS